MEFTIKAELLQAIYDYLDTRPRREVHGLCATIEKMVAEQQQAAAPLAAVPDEAEG